LTINERTWGALVGQHRPSVVTVGMDGQIVDWDEGAARMYGWQSHEAIGRRFADLVISPERRAQAEEALSASLAGSRWEGRVDVCHRDGSRFVAAVRQDPIRDDAGSPVGVMIVSVAGGAHHDETVEVKVPAAAGARPARRRESLRAGASGFVVADGPHTLAAMGVALGGIGLATWLGSTMPFGDVRPGTMGFIYEIFIIAAALIGRLLPALVGAAVGAACMLYFFSPPLHSFRVEQQTALAAAVAFLAVAAVVSWVVALQLRRSGQTTAGANRLADLADLSGRLTAATTLSEGYEAIVRSAGGLGADSSVIALASGGDRLVIVAHSGLEPGVVERWHEFSVQDATPIGDAIRERHVIVLHDFERQDRYPGLVTSSWATSVAVPLAAEGRAIGALSLTFQKHLEVDPELGSFLDALGAQCGLALARLRVVEDERRARGALAVIAQASDALAASLDPQQTVAALTDLMVPAVADHAAVHLMRTHADGSHELGVAATKGSGGPDLSDEAVAAAVWDGQPKLIPAAPGGGSAMVVPLSADGEVPGALVLGSATMAFGEEDLQLASEVARRAGVALSHSATYRRAEGDRARLDAVLRELSVGVAIAAPDGSIETANDAALRIWRSPSDHAPERVFYPDYVGYHADGRVYQADEWPLSRALRGETVVGEEIRVVFGDGTAGVISSSATPIKGGGGGVAGAVVTLFDLTTHKRNEDRLRFLADASDLLGESLDREVALARLAELAVPRLADWCSIDILEGGAIRNAAVAHFDANKVALARELQQRFPPDVDDPTGSAAVIRTGRAEFVPEITDQLLVELIDDPDLLQIIRDLHLRSAITAPLTARGTTFGALTLIQAESGRRYTQEDLELAEDLAHRAALAIDNARLYSDQVEITRTLQRSLLPVRLPDIPGLRVTTSYQPAGENNEVGGDFYDLWEIPGIGFGVAIGDVCGKGAAAAAVTSLTRHTVRTASMHEPTPSRVLRVLNDAIRRRVHDRRFSTVAYAYGRATLDGGWNLTLSLGGHPHPILLRADGTIERLGDAGTLLGIFDAVKVTDRTYHLAPGDVVVFWTDGVTERRNEGQLFGEERLEAVLRNSGGTSPDHVISAIETALNDFAPGPPQDDVALLVLQAAAATAASVPDVETEDAA
jgi:PAS domain S-box-containing protein